LQAIGSFKLRGAGNAILKMPDEQLKLGLVTISTGNMAQAVAWLVSLLFL
jgi:threonine dehydratase